MDTSECKWETKILAKKNKEDRGNFTGLFVLLCCRTRKHSIFYTGSVKNAMSM